MLLSVHYYCSYCQDSYTCFPLCPEYRTRAKIFCTRLILKYRCFRSNEAHIPIIASLLGLSVLVKVASLRIDRRTGAYISNSLISLSHVKSDKSDKDWLPKIDFATGLHNVWSSFRIIIPIFWRQYLRPFSSFKISSAVAFQLPLPMALAMTLRVGVKVCLVLLWG